MVLKKGFFFTIDSLIGASIIITGLLLVNSFYIVESSYTSLDYASHDLINSLSTLRVGEINNAYIEELISTGEITNPENTILEQIGEFWVLNKIDLCQELVENITFSLLPSGMGFSIAIGDDEVFRKEAPANQNLVSARKMISGYEKGRPVKGSTARAYLKSIREKKTASFAYFGGFVGQGNISRELEYIPSDATIDNAFIEFDAGTDFNFYINGVLCGSFSPVKVDMSSTRWNISSCNFLTGTKNNLSIIFTGLLNESFIAGGYVKVGYRTSELIGTSTPGIGYYYFPGIGGLINLYSSFDIPGTLHSIDFYLHFYNNKTTFLIIGNDTIFTSIGSSDDQTVNITSYVLPLQPGTIPIRLGSGNISEVRNITSGEPSDSVLVTDVSGSMNDEAIFDPLADCCEYDCCNYWGCSQTMTCPYEGTCNDAECGDCPWYSPEQNHRIVTGCYKTKMQLAKEADLLFVDIVLNLTGNRVGLVSYESNVRDVEPITDIKINLQDEINDYYANGGTCICCGINRAKNMLSSSSNKKFMVVMSDGAATMYCSNFNDYTGSGTGGTSDPIDKQWAINAGQNACNQNITVFAVGFGEDADHETLKQVACNESLYYNASNVENLTNIYKEIGEQILIIANYSSQTISVTGGYGELVESILYPDSYIMFNFTPVVEPPSFGEIEVAIETEKFDSCVTTVTIPEKIRVTDAKALSYSGSHWTSFLAVNGNTIFNINKYGSDYRSIGDPFVLQIPPNILTNGSNQIGLQTADSPENLTGCSKNNSMIYTAAIKSSVAYSDVLPEAEGCIWTIETEDSNLITASIPSDYSGTNLCSYTSSDINFNGQDSINLAIYELLSNLDFDNNGKININIDEEDLEIETLQISQVPYLWGPLIVEVRTWH